MEPAVLRSGEALILQAPQLGGGSNRDGLWHAAPRHHRFDCTQTRPHVDAEGFPLFKAVRGTFNSLDGMGKKLQACSRAAVTARCQPSAVASPSVFDFRGGGHHFDFTQKRARVNLAPLPPVLGGELQTVPLTARLISISSKSL